MYKIVLIVMLIISLIVLYIIFHRNMMLSLQPTLRYSDVKNKLKTGDIILFACHRYSSLTNILSYTFYRGAVGCEFIHIGLVVRINGVLCIVEMNRDDYIFDGVIRRLNYSDKGCIIISNLEHRLSHYVNNWNGQFAVRYIDKELDVNTLLRTLENYKHITFRKNTSVLMLIVCDFMGLRYPMSLPDDEMICCEFVYDILLKMGVLEYCPPHLFWTYNYLNGRFDSFTKIPYSMPIKFAC